MMKSWLSHQYQQSAALQRFVSWYQGRTAREQVLMSVALMVLIAAVLFSSISLPLQQRKADAQKRLHNAQQQYQELQLNANALLDSQMLTTYQDRNVSDLRRVLSQTAAAAEFSADRIQVDGASRLQIWASDVPFAVIAKWLSGLAQKQVGINNIQLERVSEGRVNLRIVLD